MKMEDQVCSIELAKRLKELGVKQDSLFYWKEIGLSTDRWIIDFCEKPLKEFDDRWCSAFTVAELGNLLPDTITIGDEKFYLTMSVDKHVYYENMKKDEEYWDFETSDDHNEADSRASMILHLIKYNLMELPK